MPDTAMVATCALLLCSLGLVITVQAQGCDRPSGGPNMILKDNLLDTFPDGTVVTFACIVGYQPAGGSAKSVCNAGIWSDVTLKCERKSCGSAGEVENGEVNYPTGNQFGDTAVVTCKTGYTLVGKSNIRCGEKGWMDRLPVCEVVSCKPPPQIVDGMFTPIKENYNYRDVVQYSCKKDYTLNGSNSASCSEDETFKPSPPTCVNVQCKEPNISNAEWTGGSRPPHKHQATVTYKCKSGFKMIGDGTIICEINGQWSPGLPKCQQVECKALHVDNAEKISGSETTYKYKDTVTYKCNVGYTMKGEGTLECGLNGQWSAALPKCEQVECKALHVDNAEKISGSETTYKYKDTVTYKCNVGYTMKGKDTVECDLNGQWSAALPKCEPQDCPKPVGRQNMNLKEKDALLQTFSDGTQVTFACDADYVSAGGSDVITCTLGKWSQVELKCERSHGNNYVKPLGIALGVATGILLAIGMYYFGVPAIKKKLGSRRSYPDNEAKDDEGVALS